MVHRQSLNFTRWNYDRAIISSIAIIFTVSACVGDVSSTVKTLITIEAIPYAIAVDDSHVYWSTIGALTDNGRQPTEVIDGAIMKANKDGSDVMTLAAELYPPWSIAIDSTSVYWIGMDGIKKVSKDGGKIITLVEWQVPGLPYTPDTPIDVNILVDEVSVYWTRCSSDSVMKISKKGGTPVLLASGRSCPLDIVLHERSVYWRDLSDDGSIMKVSKEGTQLVQLASNQGGATDIAVDDTGVYWTNGLNFTGGNDNTVLKMPLSGGSPTLIATNQFEANHLAVDLNYLIWVNGFTYYTIMRMPKGGGVPQKLASGENYFGEITVDSSGIFFTVPNDMALYYISN